MTLTEKLATQEMEALATDWEKWYENHSDLTLIYDEDGNIESVKFPDDCISTLCAICNGQIKALSYCRKDTGEVEFFISKGIASIKDLCI